MNIFLYSLKDTTTNLFQKKYFVFLIIGFALTYILVETGFDWWYFKNFYGTDFATYLRPGIFLGMLIPIFTPAILFVYGKIFKSERSIFLAGLIGQSAFLGWLTSSIFKAFTGRIQPNINNLAVDISHSFNFGFWEHGIFWGYPSSHTAVAFSVTFACIFVLEKTKNRKLKSALQFLLILYAFYIGFSASVSIHWFTDFLVGAILGYIVGSEVGKSFCLKE